MTPYNGKFYHKVSFSVHAFIRLMFKVLACLHKMNSATQQVGKFEIELCFDRWREAVLKFSATACSRGCRFRDKFVSIFIDFINIVLNSLIIDSLLLIFTDSCTNSQAATEDNRS